MDTNGMPQHPEFSTLNARLATFKTWRATGHTVSDKLNPQTLAGAGFYFEPFPEVPDRCVCFMCALALSNWRPEDQPIQEHKKAWPCSFVSPQSSPRHSNGSDDGLCANLLADHEEIDLFPPEDDSQYNPWKGMWKSLVSVLPDPHLKNPWEQEMCPVVELGPEEEQAVLRIQRAWALKQWRRKFNHVVEHRKRTHFNVPLGECLEFDEVKTEALKPKPRYTAQHRESFKAILPHIGQFKFLLALLLATTVLFVGALMLAVKLSRLNLKLLVSDAMGEVQLGQFLLWNTLASLLFVSLVWVIVWLSRRGIIKFVSQVEILIQTLTVRFIYLITRHEAMQLTGTHLPLIADAIFVQVPTVVASLLTVAGCIFYTCGMSYQMMFLEIALMLVLWGLAYWKSWKGVKNSKVCHIGFT
eukprot:NODE_752_length_1371_cov_43.997731_g552_i0.p1 GENE.NODE_752_length_1371_cov_43.997731_g552_i0~~NODE_752_length_1371_cov_43.997731_g552_i0.p1  ORF type:complete len:433 (-),score=108.61 NODE_752_length_1371_cov_43.997731_g552_i0:73-1314(-)